MKMKTNIGYNNLKRLIFSVPVICMISGCQKVINVDLNEAAPHIVIECLITNNRGPFKVIISKSGSYFNQPFLPPVSDAQVIITDNSGTVDTLKESIPGVYLTTKILGIPGRTYTMKVMSEDKVYTASSTMNRLVRIDSLNLTKSQSRPFGFADDNRNEIHVELNCYFRDPYEKNFYRLKVFRNDTARTENYRLFDDQYSNGQEVWLRAAHANAGNTFRIELHSLDRQTYAYYRTLEELLYSNPVFGSTPANPDSNISNGALGYFGASAVSSMSIIITDSLLKTAR
jgi:hypothetical protein